MRAVLPDQIHRPAADVRLFLIDDSGILFCRPTGRLFWLNTMASFLWCLIEEGRDPDTIADTLSQTFGLPPDDANGHFHSMIEDWSAQGLLAGTQKPKRQPGMPDPTAPVPTGVWSESDPDAHRKTRTYRILDQTVRIGFGEPDHEAWVHPLFAHLEEPAASFTGLRIDIAVHQAGIEVRVDDRPRFRVARIDQLAPAVKMFLFGHVIDTEPGLMAIHAGALHRNGGALLMPGAPMCGKSTLTAAAAFSGFDYMSDDAVILRRETMEIVGVPFSIAAKTQGLAPLHSFYPEIDAYPRHWRQDGKELCYLPPPPSLACNPRGRGIPLRWVVFPRYEAGAACTLDRLDRGEALHRIIAQAGANAALGEDDIADLIAWIGTADCHEMVHSDLDQAVAALRDLTDRDGGPPSAP